MRVTSARMLAYAVIILVAADVVLGQKAQLSDHYKILEVEPSASAQQIRSAYHKASLKWHPDKNQGSKEAEQMFIKVQEAYEVLKDPQRRAAFDAAFRYQKSRARSSASGGGRTAGGEQSEPKRGPGGSSQGEEGFSFRWEGKDMSFEELMELMKQWEAQSSTLRTAKMAFTSFVTDLSDHKMRYYLDQYLPIDPHDTFQNNMVKRVLRWVAWSGRSLLRRFLLRLETGDFSFEGSEGGHSSHRGYRARGGSPAGKRGGGRWDL